jgi:hypothetical protein
VGRIVALLPDLKMVACARVVPTPIPLDMASPDLMYNCGGWALVHGGGHGDGSAKGSLPLLWGNIVVPSR